MKEKYSDSPTFFIMSSLAGGSGSGVGKPLDFVFPDSLGTFITEQLRINFPNSCIVNFIVWPFVTGEVALQNYNILLALSRLHSVTFH